MSEPGQAGVVTDFGAKKLYEMRLAYLRSVLLGKSVNNPADLATAALDYGSATTDLVMRGLDRYLEAAARDRESAERDRVSAAEDRKSAQKDRQADRDAAKADKIKQDSDRTTMNRLTMAIMAAAFASAFGTVYGALRPWKQIVLPSPIVNVAAPAAPAVMIQPVPVSVTLAPTTMTAAPLHPAK